MITIFWATVLVQTPEGWLVAMNCYTSYASSDGHEALQLEFLIQGRFDRRRVGGDISTAVEMVKDEGGPSSNFFSVLTRAAVSISTA